MKKYLAVVLIFFVVGCGYKPASQYTRDIIKGLVFVDVDISLEDPKNSVLAKDALINILVNKLNATITDKKELANVIMQTKIDSVGLTELGYDTKGYIKTYRATVNISISYKSATKSGSTSVSGSHDFSLDDGTTISEVKRFEAIKLASDKAMSDFVSKVAIQSFK